MEYLNKSYATFLGDVIKSYGYKISDSYDPGMASSFYNSNMIELPKNKVSKIQLFCLVRLTQTCLKLHSINLAIIANQLREPVLN